MLGSERPRWQYVVYYFCGYFTLKSRNWADDSYEKHDYLKCISQFGQSNPNLMCNVWGGRISAAAWLFPVRIMLRRESRMRQKSGNVVACLTPYILRELIRLDRRVESRNCIWSLHRNWLCKDLSQNQRKLTVYRDRLKCLYVVARSLILLLLTCSAWPCLGPA